MKKFLQIISFLVFNIAAAGTVGYLGIESYLVLRKIKFPNTPYEQFPDFLELLIFLALLFIAYAIISFLLIRHIDLHKIYSKLDAFTHKTHSEINDVKQLVKSGRVPHVTGGNTADDFFINRDKLPTIEEILQTNPNNLSFSGGHLLKWVEDQEFKKYLTEKIVNVKFIFPNPKNNDVVKVFAQIINYPAENVKDYKGKIKTAVKTLKGIKNNKDAKANIEYKFCEFTPAFGLQIIENATENHNKLFVDLYTIVVNREHRYQFEVKKSNSQRSYQHFKAQFDELWNISKEKNNFFEWLKKLFDFK